MRMLSRALGMWSAAVLVSCSDAPITQIPATVSARQLATPHGGSAHGGGKARHYWMRVDKGKKTIRLASVQATAGMSSCSPDQLVCDDGSTRCQPLDPACGPWSARAVGVQRREGAHLVGHHRRNVFRP